MGVALQVIPRNCQRWAHLARRLTPPLPPQDPLLAAVASRSRALARRQPSRGLGLSRQPPVDSSSPLSGSTLSGTLMGRLRLPGWRPGRFPVSRCTAIVCRQKGESSDRLPVVLAQRWELERAAVPRLRSSSPAGAAGSAGPARDASPGTDWRWRSDGVVRGHAARGDEEHAGSRNTRGQRCSGSPTL